MLQMEVVGGGFSLRAVNRRLRHSAARASRYQERDGFHGGEQRSHPRKIALPIKAIATDIGLLVNISDRP